MWSRLYNQAYVLAMQCNHTIIINDLPYLSEIELAGVITFLIRLQAAS
jgi:hypothetical protein